MTGKACLQVRKTIIVMLTLGALVSAAAWLAGAVGETEWVFGLPETSPLPAHSARVVAVGVGSNYVYVGVRQSPDVPLSGVAEKRFRKGFNLGFRKGFNLGFPGNFRFDLLVPELGPRLAKWRPHLWKFGSGSGGLVMIPIWYTALASGMYPALAFIRGPVRRYRRRKRGLCVTCGYDLRGSPGRCPECGMEVEKT